MKNFESYFPGLKVNLSVQAQGQYYLRTAVDQRGEQTLNKDVKTVGGIKGVSGDNNVIRSSKKFKCIIFDYPT